MIVLVSLICLAAVAALGGLAFYARARLGAVEAKRDAAEKEGTAEEARIQAAVQEDARKMVESAQQEIASAAKTARRELTAYAADLALPVLRRPWRQRIRPIVSVTMFSPFSMRSN